MELQSFFEAIGWFVFALTMMFSYFGMLGEFSEKFRGRVLCAFLFLLCAWGLGYQSYKQDVIAENLHAKHFLKEL